MATTIVYASTPKSPVTMEKRKQTRANFDRGRRPKDVELTLTALEDYNLANEVVVARDGEQALDYLYSGGIQVALQ